MSETIMSLTSTFYSALAEDSIRFFPTCRKWIMDDLEYIHDRIQHEGEPFVLDVLPCFGKALETALISGCELEVSTTFERAYEGHLPKLLYWLTSKFFEDSGSLKRDPEKDPLAMSLLRTWTKVFSKYRVPASDEKVNEAITGFKSRVTRKHNITCKGVIMRQARRILADLLMPDGKLHPSIAQWVEEPFGKHGPGAVAGGEKGRNKWDFEPISSIQDPRIFQWRDEELSHWYEMDDGTYVPEAKLPISRLCVVPKDHRGPRIICAEPKEIQFAQQGLARVLCNIVASDPIASRHIHFRDQRPNFRLSRYYKRVATVDLSDASDHVSMALMRAIFPREVCDILSRVRSILVRDPDEELTRVYCYATMGSALCFPVETLVFWAIAQACVPDNVKEAADVLVFGDDIIVPLEYLDRVCDSLQQCDLIINRKKTCGPCTPVRESCGSWFWFGKDARCVQIKSFPTAKGDYAPWCACIEYAKDLYNKGFQNSAQAILDICNGILQVPYGYNGIPPMWDEDQEAVRMSLKLAGMYRYNRNLQRTEIRIPSFVAAGGKDTVPGYAGLYAWLVGNDTHPVFPGSSEKVKWEWTELRSSGV